MLLEKKRIFIVEDNLFNRSIMQTLLEQHGAQIAFERWGKDTIERLRAFSPVDLILMDLMFPNGVTGYEIFDRIRELKEFDAIPIVAVSASDISTALPRTRKKGFAGFISKPIKFHMFGKQVADLIEGQQIWETK